MIYLIDVNWFMVFSQMHSMDHKSISLFRIKCKIFYKIDKEKAINQLAVSAKSDMIFRLAIDVS